jgi:membrane protein
VPHGPWPTVKELFRRFGQDQCPAFAAALAFFAVISLVPVMLVALAGLAFVLQNPQDAILRLQHIVGNMLPGTMAQSEFQRLLVERAHVDTAVTTLMRTRGIAGVIGVLSLIWASIQIFVNAAPAMNAAYEVTETRTWLRLRLIALGLFMGAGVLFLLSLVPSAGLAAISRLHVPWLGLPQPAPAWVNALFWLVALAINITMFALVYKFLPNAPTTWREAFLGGAITGLLWELAKQGFSFYISHFGNYNKVYGGLGAIVVLLLWIYYTAMILLFGAELAALYQDRQGVAAEAQPRAVPQPDAATSRHRARS